jgi:hypothetical protein
MLGKLRKKPTKKERSIDKALVMGEYRPVKKVEFEVGALAVARRKKTVLPLLLVRLLKI